MAVYREQECDYEIVKFEKVEQEKLDCSFDDGATAAESIGDQQEYEEFWVNTEKRAFSPVEIYGMDMAWLAFFPFHSRQLIGDAILASVYGIVCDYGLALKITGMLIDLPVDEMSLFLKDYNILFFRVQEAFWALEYQRLRAQFVR